MSYVPDRGDFVWIEFNPQKGREQAGHRPALVLSPKSYNKKVGLAVCVPITSHAKGYPFEVAFSKGSLSGAILSDHVKSLDWKERKAKYAGKADDTVLHVVIARISALIISPD